jgi:enoyl-CoA hydratase/carnithine racemase
MPLVVTEPSPHVTLVTIDNEAKRNAMSRQMMAEMAALWDSLESSNCRAVVITGVGEKAFCAGADISGDLSADESAARIINRALLKDSVFSRPIVAAVNGVCAGGGVELLLSTDIRISADTARFGLPEVVWSIYPFGGATVKLINQIGYVRAMDLLLTGEMVEADFAERIGLINEVVAPADVLPKALAKAGKIADNSPTAVQAVKTQISSMIADAAKAREAMEQTLGDRVRASADFVEGVAAFREKRRPDYSNTNK